MADSHRAEVAALKACIDRKHEMLDATIRQLRKVEAERDEARREVCEWVCCGFDGAKDTAKMRGWDCFKEVQP